MNKFKPGDRVKLITTIPALAIQGFTSGSEWTVISSNEEFVQIHKDGVGTNLYASRFELAESEKPSFLPSARAIALDVASTVAIEKSVCTCDLYTQLLPYGCKCGCI